MRYRTARRRGVRAAGLVLLLALQSCFTTALWNDARERDGERCHERMSIGGRLALTPLTLLLDLLTAPIQAWLEDDDDC